jgi:hypothetical protein
MNNGDQADATQLDTPSFRIIGLDSVSLYLKDLQEPCPHIGPANRNQVLELVNVSIGIKASKSSRPYAAASSSRR